MEAADIAMSGSAAATGYQCLSQWTHPLLPLVENRQYCGTRGRMAWPWKRPKQRSYFKGIPERDGQDNWMRKNTERRAHLSRTPSERRIEHER